MPGRSQSRGFRSQRRRGRRRPQGISRPPMPAPQASSAPVAGPARAAPPPPAKEAAPDYSYVLKDLRYIGMIAGGIVIVFVILFFIWK